MDYQQEQLKRAYIPPALPFSNRRVHIQLQCVFVASPHLHRREEILQRYNGRPHWGKIHTQDASTLATLYPRWQDFQRIRAALDPQGIFLNTYLR